jgi:hypothetical protein
VATKLAELHARLPVEDLVAMIDLDAVTRHFAHPERGVVTSDR